jgi:hypothetical protein
MRIAALLVFSCILPAQTTRIVDALGGGSGGSFTTIQAAVQAANDGDVILVNPTATYDWTVTIAKSLAILGNGVLGGSARTNVSGTLWICCLRPDQRVVVANFSETTSIVDPPSCVMVTNCAGHVILSGVTATTLPPPSPALMGTAAPTLMLNVAHVAIHGSTIQGWPAIAATQSTVTASSSSFSGGDGSPFFYPLTLPSVALQAVNSQIEVSNSFFTGGSVNPGYQRSFAASSAVSLQGTALVIAGGSFTGGVVYGAGTGTNGLSIVMDYASSASFDGSALLPSGVGGGVQVLRERGRISANPWYLTRQTTSTFTLNGHPGSVGLLAIAFPGGPMPTSLGTIWMDMGSLSVLAFGTVPLTGTVSIPFWVSPGTAVSVQGLMLYQGDRTASPPLIDTVR